MEDLHNQVRNAIKLAQAEVRWRPGSETAHLLKRKVRNHLPLSATLSDYERIIKTVIHDNSARVFVYWYEQRPYPTIVSEIAEQVWLVMFDLDGVLESAYLVERPDHYLNHSEFELLGLLNEIQNEEPHGT